MLENTKEYKWDPELANPGAVELLKKVHMIGGWRMTPQQSQQAGASSSSGLNEPPLKSPRGLNTTR